MNRQNTLPLRYGTSEDSVMPPGTTGECVDMETFKKIQQEDASMIKNQSVQMLTMVDIINTYANENKNLRQQLNDMKGGSTGSINQTPLKSYFDFQSVLLIILFLFLLFILIGYIVFRG